MRRVEPRPDWAKRIAGWCAVVSIPASVICFVLATSGGWVEGGKVWPRAWYALYPSIFCAGTGLVVFLTGLRRRVCWKALVGLLCFVSGVVQLELVIFALLMLSIQ